MAAKKVVPWTKEQLAERAAHMLKMEKRRRSSAGNECKVIAQEGRYLKETKDRMDHGKWLPWVRNHLPFSPVTAACYMRVAADERTFVHLFPLGKSAIYQLMELPAEIASTLTPDSIVKVGRLKRRLSDLNCHEIALAVAHLKGGPVRQPSVLIRTLGLVAGLKKVKEERPDVYAEVADDVAALNSAPCPPCPPAKTTLTGATRDERAAEVRERLMAIVPLVPQIDDVPGPLSTTGKQGLMVPANTIWRDANSMVAYSDGGAWYSSQMR